MELIFKTSLNTAVFLSFLTNEWAVSAARHTHARPAESGSHCVLFSGLINTGLGDIYVSEQ